MHMWREETRAVVTAAKSATRRDSGSSDSGGSPPWISSTISFLFPKDSYQNTKKKKKKKKSSNENEPTLSPLRVPTTRRRLLPSIAHGRFPPWPPTSAFGFSQSHPIHPPVMAVVISVTNWKRI